MAAEVQFAEAFVQGESIGEGRVVLVRLLLLDHLHDLEGDLTLEDHAGCLLWELAEDLHHMGIRDLVGRWVGSTVDSHWTETLCGLVELHGELQLLPQPKVEALLRDQIEVSEEEVQGYNHTVEIVVRYGNTTLRDGLIDLVAIPLAEIT